MQHHYLSLLGEKNCLLAGLLVKTSSHQRLLMVCLKVAWKNVFQLGKNELNGCNGCKKYWRQRAQMLEVWGTCIYLTLG